jgi:hypothetical protein
MNCIINYTELQCIKFKDDRGNYLFYDFTQTRIEKKIMKIYNLYNKVL